MAFFYPMQKTYELKLKFTEGLCVMTMKNDAKFEEEWSCRFKTDTTV